jgi:hypothetical protein
MELRRYSFCDIGLAVSVAMSMTFIVWIVTIRVTWLAAACCHVARTIGAAKQAGAGAVELLPDRTIRIASTAWESPCRRLNRIGRLCFDSGHSPPSPGASAAGNQPPRQDGLVCPLWQGPRIRIRPSTAPEFEQAIRWPCSPRASQLRLPRIFCGSDQGFCKTTVSRGKPWLFTVALHLPAAKRNAVNALRRMGYPKSRRSGISGALSL